MAEETEVILLADKKFSGYFSSLSFQVKPSQKTSVTQRDVSPAQYAQVCSAWKRPAQTPTTPPVCATMATFWVNSRSGVNPAPNAPKARACCSAVSSTTTRCVRSATGTPTRTRKVLGSPASPAPCVMRKCYSPAPPSLIQFVKVRQSLGGRWTEPG